MADLGALNYAWRNFSAERGKARLEHLQGIEKRKAEINRLQQEITEGDKAFDSEWKERKARRREDLDNAVKSELRKGRSAQEILRELGSNNTVWIYKLRAEVMEEQGAPPSRETAHPATGSMPVFREPLAEPDANLEGVAWLHHNHTGVHGWLVSEDGNYVKRYGTEGTPYEDKWFVAEEGHSFVAGDKELFEKTPKTDFIQRVTMLHDLLDGKYTGKIRLSENKYRS